jgi:hypothetical protein
MRRHDHYRRARYHLFRQLFGRAHQALL